MGQLINQVVEVPYDDDVAQMSAAFEADVRRRVLDIRNGTGHWPEVEEVLAEMDRCKADTVQDEDDFVADDEEDAVEAAWSEEIQRRVEEIRSGAVKTYAAEDVMAAMSLRYG